MNQRYKIKVILLYVLISISLSISNVLDYGLGLDVLSKISLAMGYIWFIFVISFISVHYTEFIILKKYDSIKWINSSKAMNFINKYLGIYFVIGILGGCLALITKKYDMLYFADLSLLIGLLPTIGKIYLGKRLLIINGNIFTIKNISNIKIKVKNKITLEITYNEKVFKLYLVNNSQNEFAINSVNSFIIKNK